MPARQLVIDYVLEGHQRGYNFTSSTDGYSDAELKLIWRRAMPRGQGWSQYIGARSLKCFPLDGQRRAAVCETVVTAQRDEHGRGGNEKHAQCRTQAQHAQRPASSLPQ